MHELIIVKGKTVSLNHMHGARDNAYGVAEIL
jgi:hypothetical protein